MVPISVSERLNVSHVRDLGNRDVVNAPDTDRDGRGNLIGCPKDWVCAKRIPEMLKDYGLSALYEIEEPGSGEELLSTVARRFRQDQPVLFYMYQPVFFPGDIPVMDRAVWLSGTNSYLPQAFDRTVVRGDLISNHPEAAKIVSEFAIPGADISMALGEIEKNGASPQFLTQLARTWIDGHRTQVDSWLEGIGERSPSPPPVALEVAYSPEKEDLFLKLAIGFNVSRPQGTAPVQPIRRAMRDMLPDAVDGSFAAVSPDSSVWLPQLDRMWEQRNPGATSLISSASEYALSPIVIAMWEDRAAEFGYPDRGVGWADLMGRVLEDSSFKWSHPSATTASGLLATTAEFYAGAGKLADLTREDLEAQTTLDHVKSIESTVQRYGGESEDTIVVRMLAQGGRPPDAFVAQEQLVIYFNRNTLEDKLVAVYPEEGTFGMDHPLVLLNGEWVTDEQRRTFDDFVRFVAEPKQQRLVCQEGYRPGGPDVSLDEEVCLIKPEYKVDATEPETLLEVPQAEVLASIRDAWRLTKKAANIYLVVDVSGSMVGEKLPSAKNALFSFADQIQGERDNLALVAFSSDVREVERLGRLDAERKESFTNTIRRLQAGGGTMLYDAVAYAISGLEEAADPERINVIVAMTDGQSQGDIDVYESKISQTDPETSVLVFTVGYGDDADMDVLQRIARLGNGQAYPSDPNTIQRLYELLSAFF